MALKGFFYTISVLIIIMPMIALVSYYAYLSTQSASAGVSKTVSVEASNFINSIDFDFERALEISAKSAIVSAVDRVVSDGVPLTDARLALRTLVVNGSFPNDNQTYPIMSSNHISNWISRMQNLSQYYGLNTTIAVQTENVSVYHYDTFTLVFAANVSVFAQPLSNPEDFNFSRTYPAQITVTIEKMEDPLYALNTQGLLARVFMQNTSDVNNVTGLDNAILNKLYVPNPDAPDFFDRLEGKTSSSPFGCETFVNINELIAQDLPVHNQSMVDHIYFNETLPIEAYRVNNSAYSWFRIDCAHAYRYHVDDSVEEC
ncbi:MAG: hypothetical protein V1811_03435 [Candidatus Micrarchaeota archaeon]